MAAPPAFIVPCAPRLRPAPPAGPDWVHEIKWDGWRLQAHRSAGGARLYSRPGRDITGRFPAVVAALEALPAADFILDGELVAFGENGRPDFHLLARKRPPAVAWVFDVLSIDGVDVRLEPWSARRRRLERLMRRNRDEALHLNEVWDDGPALLRAVAEQGLEGIVSKLRRAAYRSGETDAWVKVKVPGWTESNRGRFRRPRR